MISDAVDVIGIPGVGSLVVSHIVRTASDYGIGRLVCVAMVLKVRCTAKII